jgi:hypothetical protein
MIDHKNKIIFIHLEKAGGSSIENIFTQKDWWSVEHNFLKKKIMIMDVKNMLI